MPDRTRPHRVLIIGAGFGGLATAKALRHDDVAVTIVDANNFHTFQPLLYQVATAGLSDDDVAHPVRQVFRRSSRWPFGLGVIRRSDPGEIEVVMGRVESIDVDGDAVTLADGRRLAYDTLIVAAGAVSHDFGVPGVEEHAFALKSLDDASSLRRHVLAQFERATAEPDLIGAGALDVVVCGGGPTGVEMAGGLAELFRRVLADDFPDLPVAEARITLVELADRVLTPFSEASSARARRSLERLGVDVRLGRGIRRVHADRVELDDGSTLPAGTTVWATGVRANPLVDELDMELGRGGRLPVDADLRVTGRSNVFAIGDIAAAVDDDGAPLPQVAQPAIQGGRHVAAQVLRELDGEATEPFRYVDRGSMATVGRNSAVAEFPNGWRLGGTLGWVAWLGLHLVYLMGFRNRLTVFVNWCWNYVTYDRAARRLDEGDVAGDT